VEFTNVADLAAKAAALLNRRDTTALVGRRDFLFVVKKHAVEFPVFETALKPRHHRRIIFAAAPASNVVTGAADRNQPVVIDIKAKID
jgi:hypothetical protein